MLDKSIFSVATYQLCAQDFMWSRKSPSSNGETFRQTDLWFNQSEEAESLAGFGHSPSHQSWVYPQVRISDEVGPLNRSPKILRVMLDTHFTFGPHAPDYIERALRALR